MFLVENQHIGSQNYSCQPHTRRDCVLQTFIQSKLDRQDDPEQYLKDFFDIYSR